MAEQKSRAVVAAGSSSGRASGVSLTRQVVLDVSMDPFGFVPSL